MTRTLLESGSLGPTVGEWYVASSTFTVPAGSWALVIVTVSSYTSGDFGCRFWNGSGGTQYPRITLSGVPTGTPYEWVPSISGTEVNWDIVPGGAGTYTLDWAMYHDDGISAPAFSAVGAIVG